MHTPLSFNQDEVGRQTPAKGVFPTFDGETILFCTVCASSRGVRWCVDPLVVETLKDLWAAAAMRWLVGDFLLMPDHLHFLCAPASGPWVEVESWVAY